MIGKAKKARKGRKPDKSKTFRQKKQYKRKAELKKQCKDTIRKKGVRKAVRLPPGEDLDDWLAINTVHFFNQINLLYGAVMEECTVQSCPTMSSGDGYEYLWADDSSKKPRRVCAPKYIDLLVDWVQSKLDDETLFPPTDDIPFPIDRYRPTVKKIFRRLFR